MDIEKEILGAKKGGGGGRSAQEAPNTLRSAAIVRIVEVVSEGEIVGICGGPAGIYINDTPLISSDGTENFPRAAWDYRVGLPNQDYMPGYSNTEAETVVNAAVLQGAPITRTVTDALADAAKVTIQLPNGLYEQNTSNGDLNGTTVTFTIESKLTASGSWGAAQSFTIEGKTTSPYERQYRIGRPAGTGGWDIRVTRVTANPAVSSLRNQTTFARLTSIREIKDESTEYNNTAVIGLAVDADTVGGNIPTRSFLIKGIKIQVPSNYNPVTRVYTGIWNGTFQTAWTDNPAWVLYDLLINDRYGLGEFITPGQVDKFSFYDASVYNDELLPYVKNSLAGSAPRYTFNSVINQREDAYRILQMVAGSMRATLTYFNGQISLMQDRPTAPVRLITKANVVDGLFNYKSSGLFERHTAYNITYNDKYDRYLQRVSTIDASTTTGAIQTALIAAENKYGYNPADIAAYGADDEPQAIRHGRWALDTELNQTELATWKMSLNGFDLMPGDIVKVYDEDYTADTGGGRIVSVTGTTVVIDRNVILTAGSKINVLLADGFTLEERNIVQTTGTVSTFTVSVAFSQAVLPGSDFIVTTVAQPRQFKIIALRQEELNFVNIEAAFHDPNKYARVELNVDVPSPIFSNVARTVTSEPLNLTFKESAVNIDNTIKRSLLISWTAPATGAAAYYSIQWRCDLATWETISDHASLSYELVNIQAGTYDVRVYAHTTFGNQSEPAIGSYTIATANGGVSTLASPTNLVEQTTGSTTFSGVDLNVKFTNPASNANVTSATLRDFNVRVYTTAGVLIHEEYVANVSPGSIQTYSYTFEKNNQDTGNVPNRSVKINVRCRDTKGDYSNPPTEVTFTNPTPAVPGGISVVGSTTSVKIFYSLPTDPDFAGVLIWRDIVPGFVPSAGTIIFDGTDSYIADAVTGDTIYYYRIAAYDVFAKSASGTGMNMSAEYSSSTIGVTSEDISGDISGTKIEDGTILASKIAMIGQGAALNNDPNFNDTSAWYDYLGGSIGGDSNFNSTGVLLEFNGANGSTTLVDQSPTAATITSTGVTNSTTQIKYGAASGSFNGTSRASIPNSTRLQAAGNFTAEGWVRPTGTGTAIIWTHGAGTGNVYPWQIWINATGKLAARGYDSQTTPVLAFNMASAATITAATWFHVALVRNGNTFTLYKDGVSVATATSSAALYATTAAMTLGAYDNGTTAFTGYMDDVRFTKGVARYTAAFTPPTESLPTYSTSGNAEFVTITDGYVGVTALRSAATTTWYNGVQRVPLDATKTYRVRCVAKRNATADGTFYLGVALQDSTGENISGDGLQWYYVPPAGSPANTTWTIYTGIFGAGTVKEFPGNARTMVPMLILNYGGTQGYIDVQDCRIEEQVPATLIVDGTITAVKIEAGTITGDRIAANTLTGDRIAGNTITADLMQTGIMQADNVLTRGLTVRDMDGNIILSSGVPINQNFLSGVGSNLLYNGDFSSGMDGWPYSGSSDGVITPTTTGVNLSPDWQLNPVGGSGTSTFYTRQTAPVGNPNSYYVYASKHIPVLPNENYIVSAYTGAHRCRVGIAFYEYDSAGAILTSTPISATALNNSESPGGKSLAGYKRLYDNKVTSATTSSVRVVILKWDTNAGQSDSYAFVAQVMIEAAGASSTTPSPWTPAGLIDDTAVRAGKQITAGNATTYIATAAIGSAQVGTINANQVSASSLSAITATIGTLRTAASGPRMEIMDNVIKVYDASGALRVQLGNLDL